MSSYDDHWEIKRRGERVYLSRLSNGKVVESYRPLDRAEAVLAVTEIILGYQPGCARVRLDTPFDQTTTDDGSVADALHRLMSRLDRLEYTQQAGAEMILQHLSQTPKRHY